jgi:chromosome segregation ATPase
MEDELKAIGAELAASIRREMDLEDLVDRLQSEIANPQAPGKRTSDYFSDSGVSSTKFSDYDQNKEEVEKIQRRAEQDKASLRLELTNKVQEEREKRRDLDQQIRELSERASQIDLAQMNSVDASGRVRELEKTCEDLRRRLSEEKMVKNNFEDLLSAIRSELEDASNERDNLRDEVVPQLKARVEGLEAEASEYANLTYESSKMQQELRNLKTENLNLRTTKQPSEEPPSRSSPALSRSNSVTAGFKLQRAPNGLNGPPNGLSRSNTVKGAVESREALAERLKDVEAQRDALHNALRNLLERQEFQNRENEKKIKILELERERLMTLSPGKAGFDKDIGNLRNEIKVLRRRAEEAIEHKWQAEKGLAGLKMDLDRAEEEIASLRALLKEKDILIPPSMARASSDSSKDSSPVTSEGLASSFKDLQAAYQEALDKIKALQASGATQFSDEMTQLAVQKLEQSLASAVFERDAALQEAAAYKTQADGLAESEAQHVGAERALADELRDSARRVEELATQVRQQLAANATLRQRLADTVGRGDADRKVNVERIASLQSRLRTLEDQVVAAQAASEERVARHDDQLRELKDATNLQLRRSPVSPRTKGSLSPSKGLSPLPSPMFPRSPRSPRRLPKMTIEDEVQVDKLRARVSELEQALGEAEAEMQSVIVRMSEAQIEVLTLQEEREAAVRETRRLQRELEGEKVKAFEDRFRTLSNA